MIHFKFFFCKLIKPIEYLFNLYICNSLQSLYFHILKFDEISVNSSLDLLIIGDYYRRA